MKFASNFALLAFLVASNNGGSFAPSFVAVVDACEDLIVIPQDELQGTMRGREQWSAGL